MVRQSGFAFIPILLISVFLGVVGFSIYTLYSFQPKAKQNSQASTPQPSSTSQGATAKSSPSIKTTEQLSPSVNSASSDLNRILEAVKDFEPEISWQQSLKSELEFYDYGTVTGDKITGELNINSMNRDFFSIYQDEAYWSAKGWKEDGSQMADGVTGAARGYYQDKAGQRRILNFHYDMDQADGERMFKARESLTEFKCPCKYNTEVFLSDWFNYIPTE